MRFAIGEKSIAFVSVTSVIVLSEMQLPPKQSCVSMTLLPKYFVARNTVDREGPIENTHDAKRIDRDRLNIRAGITCH